jgi:drug/metabolite transporter (DMT)-like permease
MASVAPGDAEKGEASLALIDAEKGEASTDVDTQEGESVDTEPEGEEPEEQRGATSPIDSGRARLLLGVSALVISSLSNSSQSVAVKMAGRAGCQALVTATARFMIQTVVSCWSLGGVLSPAHDIWSIGSSRRFWIIVRCVAGSLNFGIFSVVVTSMAVGEATMIKYASPVITCVLARFMLDEAWGWSESAALLACTGGVILVASAHEGGGSTHHLGHLGHGPAIVVGLVGSGCNAVRNISLKRLGKATEASGVQIAMTTAHQADLMTWLTGVAGFLMCGISALLIEGPWAFSSLCSPFCLLWVSAVGAAGYCTQWSINWGAQGGTAILNSLISYLDVVFSLTWQVAVFQEPLGFRVVLGATLAFVSVVLLTAQKACQA